MSLLALFDPSLLGRAAHPAVEFDTPDGTRELTFGDLERRSNQLARALLARGLARGDRLAVFLANCIEIVDLWLACAKLGAIVVPMNVLYREREVDHIVGDAEPRAVVTTAAQSGVLPAGAAWWDVGELARDASTQDASRPEGAGESTADTPIALVYTSGTTGAAKGAILTHGNFFANARAICDAWRITAAERFLCVLPLFHVHGLGNGIHAWLASGCHMKLVERFDALLIDTWFHDYRPTLFFGVPTIYVRLLELPESRAREIGAHMRLFVSGSAPLPAHVHEAFRLRYGLVILERYGMTETLMNAGNPLDGERRAGTVGLPMPGVRIRIVTEQGNDCEPGTSGELWVRGANVCAGYWKRPDASAAAFADGWFRSGDIGVRSTDGYLTLEGRKSDLIISGGFNIYPREIEELLAELPGVREAAVVGVPDTVRGEVPVAFLVTDAPLDTAALDAAIRLQLASFKVPRAFVRVDALPRTALGKVQKHLLSLPVAS